MNFTIQMHLTKETKGTFVYACDEAETDAEITTLYIKKSAVNLDEQPGRLAPATITVTVSS